MACHSALHLLQLLLSPDQVTGQQKEKHRHAAATPPPTVLVLRVCITSWAAATSSLSESLGPGVENRKQTGKQGSSLPLPGHVRTPTSSSLGRTEVFLSRLHLHMLSTQAWGCLESRPGDTSSGVLCVLHSGGWHLRSVRGAAPRTASASLSSTPRRVKRRRGEAEDAYPMTPRARTRSDPAPPPVSRPPWPLLP